MASRHGSEASRATPPKTAVTQVHGYVLRLRRLLGDRDGRVLGTAVPGYRLTAGVTDAAEFEELAGRGHRALRDGDRERAAENTRCANGSGSS